MIRQSKFYGVIRVFFCVFIVLPRILEADQQSRFSPVDNQFGGQLRLEAGITGYDGNSYFEAVGTDTGLDGAANGRLTDRLTFSDTLYIETHYEAAVRAGDTYQKQVDLKKNFPALSGTLLLNPSDMDRRRLFDLTKVLKETDDYLLWHRLDRFFVSVKSSRVDFQVGRQAITWGNGLIFNPMDLFNPFSPSDIVRDYKMGDDLVSVWFHTDQIEEVNLLYVPRRDITTGEVDFKKSSAAGKAHFFAGDHEMDIMAALHYDQIVAGVGITGYLGDAAFRCDMIWSSLEEKADQSGYVELVANIDYSWTWYHKNIYGLFEYYHNGLGKDNYTDAMSDAILMERIDRGELFALGKDYINGRLQVELHPLVNLYLSAVTNIHDPSGVFQPWVTVSMTQNSTLLLGANIFYGSGGTEYGGFLIPGTTAYTNAAANAYLLFTVYF